MLVERVTGANVMAVVGATVISFEGGLDGGGTYDDVKPKKWHGRLGFLHQKKQRKRFAQRKSEFLPVIESLS